ncbi:amidohydrolase [Sulfodiicoccus acidiphilus]|uniref:Amidohydrolase n=1 Tax=Sulfodiicoccus acidiphilus TaxID=1670455 RepID=A0A348B4Y3_9CREN|nr:amidohydrolase family protein [Sulfodiicoccus acidiphilus]BBD73235.1 amidohydrolase [Sulfodiicoccus acidiphilus]GGT89712.1 amidohydrolase [Sulfodiicoccus acidiphilus]
MGFVDAHTHLWFNEVVTPDMLERSSSVGHRIPIFYREQVLREMDDANLEYVVIVAYPMRKLWGAKEDFPIRTLRALRDVPDRFSVVGGVEVTSLTTEETLKWLGAQYEAGVSGFKLHPPHMWIKPNDYRPEERGVKQLEVLYQFAEDHSLPVMIHTGTSSFLPSRNKYGDPVFVDDVVVDFPRLKVILAHMGRPNWVGSAFQLVRIRKNLWGDVSSIPPKRLLNYLPRLEEVRDKMLYGSDVGDLGVKGLSSNLEEFLQVSVSEESKVLMASTNPRQIYHKIER